MAIIRYTGNAIPVAQVDTFTPANCNEDDIFYLTVTGLDGSVAQVSFTCGSTETVAAVCAGLVAAWNASTNALCTGITAANNTTNITLTADTPGDAFSVASSIYDGGGGSAPTLTRAATTANAGPKNWADDDNWSGGSVPGGAASQDVYVDGATLLYGLDQSGIANTLDSLDVSRTQIGNNPISGILPTYLQIKASEIVVDAYDGPGTPVPKVPINIDSGSTASEVTVYNSGTNGTNPAIRLKADSASTNVTIYKGRVGIAYLPGETSTFGTIAAYYGSDVNNDVKLTIGSGVTLTTYLQTGGDNELICGCTTATITGGALTTEGSGTITTLNADGGTITANSTGTITNLNVQPESGRFVTVDFTGSAEARTVTNCALDPGGTLKYDPAVITFTNYIISSKRVKYVATAA